MGDILAHTGGFGMGLSLGHILFNSHESTVYTPFGETSKVKPNNSARLTVFGVSAAIALLSIPFFSGAVKNFKKAVATENEEAMAFQPYFKVESAGNGMAMSYNF